MALAAAHAVLSLLAAAGTVMEEEEGRGLLAIRDGKGR